MNIFRFRLITFDVTDTLLKLRSPQGQQYSEVGAMFGCPIANSHSLSANFKTHWNRMNAEHPNFGKNSGLGWEMWWKHIVRGTFKDSKIDLDDAKLQSVTTHLIRIYETSMGWQYCCGALGLLSYLRNLKIPLGVISNFDPTLNRMLINTKLRHYFDFVVGSYEVGVAKPSAEIFEKAIEMSQVERLKPEECLHIGNTPSLDYVGARNCGWNAILIQDMDRTKFNEKYPHIDANFVFSNLHNLHLHLLEHN